jgi:hypothetical protein
VPRRHSLGAAALDGARGKDGDKGRKLGRRLVPFDLEQKELAEREVIARRGRVKRNVRYR